MISGKPTQPCSHDGSSRKEVISIADKKFRGRDKIVQKMTKDGLVDENLRTGEQKSATAAEKPEQEDSAKETAKKETDKKIFAYKIDKYGAAVKIPGSYYDSDTKTVNFVSRGFFTVAVGCEK